MALKFKCEQSDFLKAISIANRAVVSRGTLLTALTGVHLDLDGDVLTATGSDLDLTIATRIEVAGQESGTAVIPAKLLADVARALPPGAVEVEAGEEHARLVAGTLEFAIRVLPVHDWPVLPSVDGDAEEIGGEEFRDALGQVVSTASSDDAVTTDAVTTDAGAFRDALGQVVRSASTDDTRPILTGVLMSAEEDGIRLVSTDSYRLSLRDLPGSALLGNRSDVLVPGRALGELRRMIGDSEQVTLKLSETRAQFDVGNSRLVARLIDGKFPNYRGLIPDSHPNKLTVDRAQLLAVVRRVSLLAQDKAPVRFTMTVDNLELRAITQDVGYASESLPASYEGEDLTMAFNPGYLTDGLEIVDSEQVTLHTADPLKPALLRPVGDDGFLYLVMPVRVS